MTWANLIRRIVPWLVLPGMAFFWLGVHTPNVLYYFPAAILVTVAFWPGPPKNRPGKYTLALAIGFCVFCTFLYPDLSDDFHRYLWEGHVQNHGISPYLHSPQSLYQQFDHPSEGLINNDHLPAIYPPLAQYLFRLSDLITTQVWGWKLILVLWSAAWSLLLRRRTLLWLMIIPIAAIEGWWNGHLDLAGLVPCLVLVESLERQRPFLAGLSLGSLIALKIMPIIWLPFAFRHLPSQQRIKFFATTFGVVVLCYAPFLIQGEALFHSFLTFSKTWSFNNLPYIVLSEIFGTSAARLTLAISFFVSFAMVFFMVKGLRTQCLYAWILLIICSPTFYPWYLLWLLPMVPLKGFRVYDLAYLAAFLSYWVLVDYRARNVWREQWQWLVLEWLILGFCFVKLMRLSHLDPKNQSDRSHTNLQTDAT